MEFRRHFDGITPYKPVACLGGVGEKRNHLKIVLARNAGQYEPKLRRLSEIVRVLVRLKK
jgi:hypothetical protein